MCVTLWRKNMMFFWTKMRVSLWLGVCIYTYGYIYINADDDDDDDILGHFLFWSAVFLVFIFYFVLFWKGNNTFDGKIIVTWLKIARLCGCLAYQGHNIYDVKEPAAGLVYKSEMIFFFFLFKKKKKKKCWLLWTKLCFCPCFISSERKQLIFSWVMQMFHHVWLFILFVFFFFSFFFLNVCNTVMMTWCHVEMSAVLFLYVCVQASKEIIKLKSSVYAYISSWSHQKALLTTPPLPPPLPFSKKSFVGETPPPPSLSISPSL